MSYTSTITADSPLMFWELNETSGTTAADSSGNGKTGTYAGGYTQGSTPLITAGNAVVFDGSSGKVTSPALSTITGDFSAEFWAKVTPSAGYGQADNFGAYGGLSKNRMIIRPGGYYFSVWIGGTERVVQFNPGGDIHTNKVIYWCFQRSGTSLLVFRGIVGTDSSPQQIDSLAGVATTAVDLSGALANEPNSASWFKGPMDELALYAVALSSTQRNNHYSAGLAAAASLGSRMLMGVGL